MENSTKNQGIIATFYSDKNLIHQLTFKTFTPLTFGYRWKGKVFNDYTVSTGILNPRYSYHDNEYHLKRFIMTSKEKGFFNFGKFEIPFDKITEIQKEYFEYDLPITPFVSMHDDGNW